MLSAHFLNATARSRGISYHTGLKPNACAFQETIGQTPISPMPINIQRLK